MCGFAGYVNLDGAPADAAVADAMGALIAHRGPDDAGAFAEASFAGAHRRLSIIDLSPGGHQPFLSVDGRYVLLYNGELYNYREMKRELESLGWRFRSTCDTEVVLHALIEWGTGALLRFNGMFALALYDRRERSLVLARDRFGQKPLYVARMGRILMFASEVKAFLGHPATRFDLDQAGLVEYFTFQNFFTPRTLFRNVTLLPAAHSLTVAAARTVPNPVRYWDYRFVEGEVEGSEDELADRLESLFVTAVERQLVSDCGVSSYLSGGMDSGAVSAIASRRTSELHTFTIGFDKHSMSGLEIAIDERERAEHMSYLFGTRHYEMVLKAGDMERCLSKLVWHLEEPRVGQSYPNYYAAHLASRFSKVVLCGAGGDEMFGGYPWRYSRALDASGADHFFDLYYDLWQRLLPDDLIRRCVPASEDPSVRVDTREIFRDVLQSHNPHPKTPEDYVNQSLYLEARTFLHGLLVVEDKLSMAHGLETRAPFLDNDLVDFAMALPVRHKLGAVSGDLRADENDLRKRRINRRDGKLLLRRMLGRIVPTEISEGEKVGFSAPDEAWFKGDSLEFVRERLFDSSAAIYDHMDFSVVKGLVEEHVSGKSNRRLLIWSLLYFDEFSRAFLKDSHAAAVPKLDVMAASNTRTALG
jgi:asparagine synthase (glutamine-hydrolysing)